MAKAAKESVESPKLGIGHNKRIIEGDRMLWIIFMVLVVVSILVVYSSTAKMAYDISSKTTTADTLRQQIMLVVMAIPLLFVVHKIDYKHFKRLTPLLYYLFIILTIATYFMGATTNGAARWIAIGPIQFQPSEGLKIMTILMLARKMDLFKGNINKINIVPTSWRLTDPKQTKILKENTYPILGPVITSCAVILPAHTSSAVLVFLTSVIMLYIGRVRIKEILKFVGMMCCAGVLALVILSAIGMGRGETAGGRLSAWAEAWTGEDTVNNMYELTHTARHDSYPRRRSLWRGCRTEHCTRGGHTPRERLRLLLLYIGVWTNHRTDTDVPILVDILPLDRDFPPLYDGVPRTYDPGPRHAYNMPGTATHPRTGTHNTRDRTDATSDFARWIVVALYNHSLRHNTQC